MEKDILAHIKNAKLGEQSAYKALLNHYWNDIYRFQMAKTNNENEAEDITIQTFSKAFDKIDLFDEKYNFKSWILTISRNIQIDEFRKAKTPTISLNNDLKESYDITDETPSPEDQLIIEQNLAELLRFIKKLKPHYQQIINLRYFQELSYKEIAKELDEPLNNVKVKLLRAKKLLAEIIAER
ncbi:sigma-70 family RNA polymerase sigma factor [Flavicella sp.]|uniref:RNA polymerase sigma factor n=1 Tax=Flavicella sp. TaxID=2957742 RepID=UPI00262E886A|nr:sigma-70 family RNA polymerase sigma factor [Flavicella sp.]MDG1805559.1 sigma-70 family RNA polymerase sigma factor [Flavicella sp.]